MTSQTAAVAEQREAESSKADPPAVESPMREVVVGQRRSVVVVANSDPTERGRWKSALEAAGHGVIEAPTLLVLLELAARQQPDLVVCSTNPGELSPGMDPPEIDGFEVLRFIRNNALTARVPCLLTSNDSQDWRKAMAKGADDFLASPVKEQELLEAVEARLERQRTLSELATRNAFESFPAELLELVVKKTPVAEVLQRISQQLEEGIGAIAVVPRLSHGDQLETIQALRFSPRSWAELDRLIGKLLVDGMPCPNPARKELAIALSSSLLVFFGSQKINQKPGLLWHVPIRSENGGLLGSFEIFLGQEADASRWISGPNRAALDPVFRLAGVLMERQHLFDELTRQTHFDSVTGLPNRKEFERHLEEAHRRGETSGGTFAILCLDIDRFQRVNDTYGYEVADRLLGDVAARLRQQSRGQDLVARISGDEFAMLVPDAPERSQLQRLAGRLIDCLSQPYLVMQHRIVISITAGIAHYPEDSTSAGELLARAEMALASARRSPHGSVALFQQKAPAETVDGVDIESYLERALAVQGFVLHYQPIYRNRGGCCGYEALVRLRRGLLDSVDENLASQQPELVAPGLFLPIAEESGLIVPLGAWIFDEACRQLREWNDLGFHCPLIAVNLSARQLTSPDLVATFAASMARHNVSPEQLEVELTETAIIADYQSGKKRLEELKQLGLHISIDDFGIGYSSLSYLNNFPADKIKIDQSFVRRLGTAHSADPGSLLPSPNPRRADPSLPVIGAILSLAASLGADVVAEGVETPEQYRILSDAGCHEFQGFLFARPMGATALMAFINEHRGWTADWFAARMPDDESAG
jgi:diguanylate cyclase (GGDEF)-like protein